ncbi:hypothetical protein PC41400_18405 [Paenibacillus chitinolyticus]|uniref:EamA domain-containing protein n=1 Tax=Paenibacillus chitinolyticus TaxID=79263 RepID=A0A410WYJ6_9BACL|nr:hypothetical protein PC41400_18405 [Paenibacillus chitinolyticus]
MFSRVNYPFLDEERSLPINLLYLVVAIAIMILGILHICITPKVFKAMTPESIWFVSGGLAIISNATLNLARISTKPESGMLDYFCYANNALTLLFSLILVRVLPRPQTKLFACLMFLETLSGFLVKF